MLGLALSWIPIVGPLLQGLLSTVTTIFTKHEDTIVEKYKVDGSVDTTAMQTSAQIISDTHDDIGVRLLRDLALTPPVVWSALIGWDTIMAKHFPDWMFHVADYPTNVQYIPYMAFVFLFGAVGLTLWKRR